MSEPSFPDVTGTPSPPRTGQPPAMPRWVKAALVLVGLVGIVLLAKAAIGGGRGIGGHGPGMHGGLGVPDAGRTVAAAVTHG